MKLRTRRTALVIAVFVGCSCVLSRISHAKSIVSAERKDDAAKVSETYNFRFGKDKPSLLGNAAVASARDVASFSAASIQIMHRLAID